MKVFIRERAQGLRASSGIRKDEARIRIRGNERATWVGEEGGSSPYPSATPSLFSPST